MTEGVGARRSLGFLLVLMTATISGVAAFVNFWAVQGTNSDAFIALRNGTVALILLPMVFLVRREVRAKLHAGDWIRLAAIGLIGGAIPFLLFFRGLQLAGQAGAASATFGYRTLFLMATVLGFVVLKERLQGRMLVAAGLLLAGNVLLLSLTSPVWTDGGTLVLLATALWAGEYAVSKRALRDLPSGTVAAARMGFGAMFLLAYLGLTDQVRALAGFTVAQVEWMTLSAILLVGFVSTWYAGLKQVDLSQATAVLVLGFPITWALSVLAGTTAFGIVSAAGVVTIVLGVALAVGLAAIRETWWAVARFLLARARSPAWR